MQKEIFHKEDYFIKKISYKEAMEIVVKYHYLHRVAPCSMAFGLFQKKDNKIIGVITYGVSSSSTLLKGICGQDEMHNVYELTRLWIRDGTPCNAESFLIGNTLKKLDKEIIVSFSEKDVGHVGTVYQATNFIFCGLSTAFTDPVVKGLEGKHHSTFAHGMTVKEIKEKWGDDVKFVERPRKYRYIYFNANKKRKKELIKKLKYPLLPYPKGEGSVNTVSGKVPEILLEQLELF